MKNILTKYKQLIENFISLYFLKVANIIIPLITLPYLVRVLGVNGYGVISFAQVFAGFFVMFVDFGFNLSITRDISVNSDDTSKVSQIVSTVFIIKGLLLLIGFIVYSFIVTYFDKFNNHYMLHILMYGIVIGQGLFPDWYFQGMQKMRYITILNVVIKIIFLILILTLIKSSEDVLEYPILLSLGYIGILPFAYYIAKKEFNYKFIFPSIKDIIYYIKYSSHFFLSRIAVRVYGGSTGVFVVGLIAPELILGYYSVADKLKYAISSMYSPVSQVLYPYISKDRNIKVYKKIFYLINLINLFAIIILFIFAKEILEFIFNINSDVSVEIFRIFLIFLAFNIPSILIGYPLLGAMGYSNFANYSVVATAIIYSIIMSILYYFNLLNVYVVAWMYVVSVLIELGIRFYGVLKYKLLSGGIK